MKSRPTKVLVVAAAEGGIGRYGVEFANALQATPGTAVELIINETILESAIFGPRVKALNYSEIQMKNTWHRLKSLYKIWRTARNWRADIIHDISGHSGPFAAAIWITIRLAGCRLVVTEHDPEPHSSMGQAWGKRIARFLLPRLAAMIMVHGRASHEAMTFRVGARCRVVIVNHGAMECYLRPVGSRPTVKRRTEPSLKVLFFGAMRPNKGVHWLIPIADRLKAKGIDARFVVAGSRRLGKEFRLNGWVAQLETMLDVMRSRRDFEIYDEGFIKDEDVAMFFSAADIVILPYLDASSSGVLMTAMAFGKPVLATAVGDLPDVIEDGLTGFLTDRSLEDFNKRLEWMVHHPKQRDKVAVNLRRVGHEKYSWRKTAAQAAAYYGELAELGIRN